MNNEQMGIIEKYERINVLKGKTIKEIKLWGDAIEIIPTEGSSLVINIKQTQKMDFVPWIRVKKAARVGPRVSNLIDSNYLDSRPKEDYYNDLEEEELQHDNGVN